MVDSISKAMGLCGNLDGKASIQEPFEILVERAFSRAKLFCETNKFEAEGILLSIRYQLTCRKLNFTNRKRRL